LDFVVVGLTLGALAVLAGVILLGWETGRWQRHAARAESSATAARYIAIAADRRSTGEALLYAGAAIVLATVGALVGSLDDRTGAFFVVTTVTVAAGGILLRAYLHRARHPIPVAPRRVTRPVPSAITAASGINVLFSEPTHGNASAALGDVETTEAEAPAVAPVDETVDPADTTPTEPSDDALEGELAVAVTNRGSADDEDSAPENQKVVG
jgi:hypothetical protein